jgi:Transglycosylase SLT domain
LGVILVTRTVEGAMRRGILAGALVGASLALMTASAATAASKTKRHVSAATVQQIIDSGGGSVQLVSFPETGWSSVKVVRGGLSAARNQSGSNASAEKAEAAEIVTFADPRARPVRVLRGDAAVASAQARPAKVMDMQVVSFASPENRSVTIFRGASSDAPETGLFAPASAADLDRVAFAVDGAESSHGFDLRMWRSEPSGPQGPMQVTKAAAIDVGGGDRFDLVENRALGRAYLARMFTRYGNWPDAVAAYNWGPGNVDAWIGGGRLANLPLEVERYRDRVLRDAALAGASAAMILRRVPGTVGWVEQSETHHPAGEQAMGFASRSTHSTGSAERGDDVFGE